MKLASGYKQWAKAAPLSNFTCQISTNSGRRQNILLFTLLDGGVGLLRITSNKSSSSSYSVIVRVKAVLKRTLVGDYLHPDNHTIRITDTPGFKPFTNPVVQCIHVGLANIHM